MNAPQEFVQQDGDAALQEVYRHLNTSDGSGNMYIAWSGQCRAKGYTHANAMKDTIAHFGLANHGWYQARFAPRTASPLEEEVAEHFHPGEFYGCRKDHRKDHRP